MGETPAGQRGEWDEREEQGTLGERRDLFARGRQGRAAQARGWEWRAALAGAGARARPERAAGSSMAVPGAGEPVGG